MKSTWVAHILILTIACFHAMAFSQPKVEKDSLYERLKKTDINKMTEREYQYFILMKRTELGSGDVDTVKKGVLNGVATYYFNENYGDKPDVGTEVFILPETHKDKCKDLMAFYLEVLSRNNRANTRMTDTEFSDLESKCFGFMAVLENNRLSEVRKVIVDGAGSFSLSVPAGAYCLVASSAHLRSVSNIVEIMAQIDVTSAQVTAGQSTSVKIRFLPR